MKNVLIVDDNPHSRELIKFALKTGEYKIQEASNGQNAMNILLNETPDLIILDWLMPELCGRSMIMLTDQILAAIEKLEKTNKRKFYVIVYSSVKIPDLELPNTQHFKYLCYISKEWSLDRQIDRLQTISKAKLGVAA